MSFSYRPLLVPAIALATAGVVALGPTVVAPPALTVARSAVPAVQTHEVQLAGIGQDVYQFVTEWVQYGVDLVQYGVSLIPFIGGPIADQIDIIYFDTLQPAVQDTVNYLASVVQNPFNLIGETASYLNQLYGLAYNFVAAELAFFGFPILPPLPPIAASVSPGAALAGGYRGAAAAVESTTVADLAEEVGAGEVVSVEIAAPAELEVARPRGGGGARGRRARGAAAGSGARAGRRARRRARHGVHCRARHRARGRGGTRGRGGSRVGHRGRACRGRRGTRGSRRHGGSARPGRSR